MDDKAEKVALFRYGLIAPLVLETLPRGIPTRLYMDNAKIYRSPQLARIAASIGILIVIPRPINPKAAARSSASFVPCASNSWPRSIPKLYSLSIS